MALEWSGSGPELLLTLNRDRTEPLRAQLEGQLRTAIRTGRLRLDERLPSSRELAHALGVSRGLVQDCYAQLQAEGYLVTRGGSATRVAAAAAQPGPVPVPAVARAAPRLRADFAHGVPDLAGFPRADWTWALREACRTAPTADLNYGDPQGSAVLRDVLAGYLRRVRAAVADGQHIVVCTGFAQGLGLVLRALARAGVATIAFEDPGSPRSSRAAASAAGFTAVPVPVDEGGIDVAALAATDARAVLVTPAHQWPTGVVLAPQRRLALLEWAAERDAIVIEDDYDAEFRYDREPVGALQGLGADRVVTIGTVSKSLAPSLRLGWVVCPPALVADVTRGKDIADRGSPVLEQLALATLIESGRYDRQLRRMRTVYAERRQALVGALQRHAPHVRLSGLADGFHAVAHLPGGADEAGLIAAARDRSVGLYGMSQQRFDGAATPPALVLGFGNIGERAIHGGVAAIRDLL
jgi:GntR family transcriptional regulator / MocR family aminotransferase